MKFESTYDKRKRVAIVFFVDKRKPHKYQYNLIDKYLPMFERYVTTIGAEYINYYDKKSTEFMYQQDICRKKNPTV